MIHFQSLPKARKDSLLQLVRSEKGLNALLDTLNDEVALETQQYERAKEALVVTGNNRDTCIGMRSRIATLNEVIDLLNNLRKI